MKVEGAASIPARAVEVEGAKGVRIRRLITGDDGAENIAMRMFEVEPAGHTPLHAHSHEHLVFIVEGRGVFVCQDTEYSFDKEHVIFVPGQIKHQFRNTGDSVLRFLCIIPAWAS